MTEPGGSRFDNLAVDGDCDEGSAAAVVDEQKPPSERFIIQDKALDDFTLLVQPKAVDTIREFLALQQQRAQLYARWHMGHRRYCESRQEGGLFRALLAATTASFQEVSQAVRGVEAELRADQGEGGAGRPDLAGLLRRVQLNLPGVEVSGPHCPQRISMIDSALHFSVGFSREPLKRAFAKTGLYPPNKEQLLAAAKASIQGGKGMATLAPWKRLTVTNDMMDAAVRRSAEEQPPLYFRAVDQFYNRQELEEQDSEREKLRLTLSLQSLRTAAAFGTFSWQHGHVEGGAELGVGHGAPLEPGHAPGPSAAGLQPDSLLLSKGHGHGCCSCGAGEGAGGQGGQEEEEPSEAEYTAAVQEALLLLDRCIADINDALEEVRYALEEMQE
ncbi:hypothetical protein QJQ45_006062 [Haematococcus lacustris]|nr:hypothetical protein QJQ45_006062 [Haematococcus lacustris]